MAVALGKRKRHERERIDHAEDVEDGDARARFQRAFEAKFKPLRKTEKSSASSKADPPEAVLNVVQDEDQISDWSGLSDEDDAVEIVEHALAGATASEDLAKQELKAFMSSKPPALTAQTRPIASKPAQSEPEDEAEASNLKHDLALQRLLRESHLLDHSAASSSSAVPEGKSRIKALDLRIQDLGAKNSHLTQEKMPIAHRKGIVAKASSRESARRKEAVENGVILEKVKSVSQPQKRRERGIGAPSVGKFRGGTLKLSSRDVRSVEGPKRAGGKGRKR
ncbi:pre-rRNA processing and 40S ribosomal subunit assembly [Teratosphaeriaceae sp. CCFEE 6253]|nr:pre-rRNA processing and 40S ribosomal subunit assembly [Teratosphaeriaceae sp. CCFEE 6253]